MKNYLCDKIHNLRAKQNQAIGQKLTQALSKIDDHIPCFIVSYNNPSYVENMVLQLRKLEITPIIFDNKSTDPNAVALLSALDGDMAHVIYVERNLGHKVGFLPGIYPMMPSVFAYTDPDMLLNKNIPPSFLNTLHELTKEYGVFKAGFSLDLDAGPLIEGLFVEKNKCRSIPFRKKYSLEEWEGLNWKYQLKRPDDLIVYKASVDTTFAVYNKDMYSGDFLDGVRVAGDFSSIHLPWFPDLDLMDTEEKRSYLTNNKSSTWVSE